MFGGGVENLRDPNNRKQIGVMVVALLLLVVAVIGLTYAAFNFTRRGTKNNQVSTARVTMTYTEDTNGITLDNAMPESDAVGRITTDSSKLFQFTIAITTTNVPVTFEVTAEKDEHSTLTNNDVRIYLERSSDGTNYSSVMEPTGYKAIGEDDELGAKSNEMRLDWGTVSSDTTYQYILRMWVSENYVVGDVAKYFTIKVNAYGKDGEIDLDPPTATKTIAELVSSNPDTMFTDEAGNIRYMGKTPNNYVTFNGETAGWRIVGVFGDNIKLVRNTSIGNYSWDTSDSSVNSGWGVNDWTQADSMKLLNDGYSSESVGGSLYWNRGSGTCYKGRNNATKSCDFSSTSRTPPGLTSEAQNMIETTTWYLGGWNTSDVTASAMYGYERGTTVYIGRPTEWTGKVGLLYPSDYGFASSACKDGSKTLSNYNDSTCTSTNWLKDGSVYWFLSPASNDAYIAFYVSDGGYVSRYNAGVDVYCDVRPAVYLKSSVTIAKGDSDGSYSKPYVLEMN